MAFTLFTGGMRSGKSRLALHWAGQISQQGLFIATCMPGNAEMKARIAKHQKYRGPAWHLLEEPLDPCLALDDYLQANQSYQGAIALDSLGMWITNLMAQNISQAAILRKASALAAFFSNLSLPAAIITEECGLGVGPANPIAGKFADILGVANQLMANAAQNVIFTVCGLPLALKGDLPQCLRNNPETNVEASKQT